ncbi:MAG: hypothetical protein L6R45_32580 [Anaerolineae bacterium]|nr:hypothetical protein [Anaerolineae bacterium]
MSQTKQIGFSQRIQLAWLEQTAMLLLAGKNKEEIQAALHDLLQDKLSKDSEARWGNRGKAVTILLNTWVSVPSAIKGLRDNGLELWRTLPLQDHLPLHWGMSMAAYPFFGAVAETTGRLLQLQGTVAAAQVQRRLREQFGERETVARAGRRILRSFIDWGVLQDTAEKGVYQAGPVKIIKDPALAAWLIEATLIASDSQSKPLQTIIQSPILFPFSITLPSSSQLEQNDRLELFRQGLDTDMVSLRNHVIFM